jgi:sugar phosphate isomerase/epimerase
LTRRDTLRVLLRGDHPRRAGTGFGDPVREAAGCRKHHRRCHRRALLKRIDERCTQAGLTFGIHNHFFKTKFAYESPEDVLRALTGLSKTVGATADVGQFASCGYDTVDAVRKLGPYLKLVHLKDIAAAGAEDNVLLGRGIAKIPEVMRELHKLTSADWWRLSTRRKVR